MGMKNSPWQTRDRPVTGVFRNLSNVGEIYIHWPECQWNSPSYSESFEPPPWQTRDRPVTGFDMITSSIYIYIFKMISLSLKHIYIYFCWSWSCLCLKPPTPVGGSTFSLPCCTMGKNGEKTVEPSQARLFSSEKNIVTSPTICSHGHLSLAGGDGRCLGCSQTKKGHAFESCGFYS